MDNGPRVPTVPPHPGGGGGALIEAGDFFHIFHSVPLGQGKDFSTKKKKKKKKIGQNYHQGCALTLKPHILVFLAHILGKIHNIKKN